MGRAAEVRRTIRQQRAWGWFWYCNIPAVVAAYFVLDRETFVSVSLLYLAVVSVWALGISHHARAEAAGAELAGLDDE